MAERNTRVRASQIISILPSDIESTNSEVDNYVPSYDLATGKFTWIPAAVDVVNIEDLGDVDFDSGTPIDGQILTYDDGSSKWKAGDADFVLESEWNQNGFATITTSTLTWTDLTPDYTLSIQPTVTSFEYWIAGVKYTSTGDTVQIDNTKEGVHYIYYDGDTLTAKANPTTDDVIDCIKTKCLVAIIYWNTTDSTAIYVGEERHGYGMSPNTHNYLHFTLGLAYLNGLGLNTILADEDGSNNTHTQFGVDTGSVADEDLNLSPDAIASNVGLPIYYMLGADAEWQKFTNAGFSIRTEDNTDATRLAYNQYTGGAWQLTEIGSGNFVLYHVFATTEKDKPMLCIMGQNEYTNKTRARTGALTEIRSLVLNDILFPEIHPIATIIYQTNLAYTNDVNARIVSTDEGDDYIDWRNEVISRVAMSTSDHNSLSGLQGGTTSEYYHLTSSEHTELTNWLDSVVLNTNGSMDLGTGSLTINSIEIVGVDGEVNKAAVEDSGNWDDAYTHVSNDGSDHDFIDQDVTSGSTPTLSGVAFPASQSASADVNTLDDYEEGYYTVTLTCGISGTITIDGGNNELAYTKIGRVVHVQGYFIVSSVSSPVGALTMNLPFTATDLTKRAERFTGSIKVITLGASLNAINLDSVAASNVRLTEWNGTTEVDDISDHIQATTAFWVGFTYLVE